MVERRRFRRRKRVEETPEDRPILPLERREERLARRRADREAVAAQAAQATDAAQAAQATDAAQAAQAAVAEPPRPQTAQTGNQDRQPAQPDVQPDARRPEPRPDQIPEPRSAEAQVQPRRPRPPEPQPASAAAPPGQPPRRSVSRRPAPQAQLLWDRLPLFEVDSEHLEHSRIITASREDPAHTAFDVLRTRLTQALAENGWTRVGITSPSKGCGKTFTAANLAISLSRQEGLRALLMDLDLRNPSLHKAMGVRAPGCMGALLRGAISPEAHLMRMGENHIHAGHDIAFGFNEVVEPYAAELLNAPATAEVLATIETRLQPDVMLFDLPPALYYDDVLAFRPQIDGVLLVVGGGLTTEREIREVERRLGTATPLLGMVLNRAEGTELKKYQY